MSSLDKQHLRYSMRQASREQLELLWPQIKEYIEAENRKLVETFKLIEVLRQAGKIDPQTAHSLLEGQKVSRQAALEAVDGMTTIMIENSLNAALDSVREAVNTVLQFKLL